jgi:hypothetical protein
MQSSHTRSKSGLLATALLALAVSIPGCAAPTSQNLGSASLEKQNTLRQEMRKLWVDHIAWTRLVIVSTAAGLPDLQATTERLLQNQTDIGDAIKPFYGDSAGAQLTVLLREHIVGAANVLAAAKAHQEAKLAEAKTAWYANADDIATFLNNANPGAWPAETMREMMKEHLDLTLAEAVDQLQGNYPASVADYDKVQVSILHLADMLSGGIIEQFPKQF